MRYLSVCSGIEAATVAWHSLGWKPVGFSEIEPFPSAVLAHHYPNVTNFGDMTKYKEWNIEHPDILVGGTPCQSFSVAGLRKGLDDPRGNLALTYCGILDHFRPQWFVWENVPGVLSSSGGRDFGSFLGALAELGYGFAYRVLDAQFFGVAQRRRRVFVVGYLGDWRPPAAVLFERKSLRRDTAPSREARQIAPTIPSRSTGVSRVGFNCEDQWFIEHPAVVGTLTARNVTSLGAPEVDGGQFIPTKRWPANVAPTLNAHFGEKQGLEDQHALGGAGLFVPAKPIPLDLRNAGRDPEKHDEINRQGVGVGDEGDPAHTVTTACVHGVAQPITQYGEIAGSLTARHDSSPCADRGANVLAQSMAVRRLTPVECERLQGFPDNYTNIPWRKKDESPDGPRYKALGNSMAVPVMRWIGSRIKLVSKVLTSS